MTSTADKTSLPDLPAPIIQTALQSAQQAFAADEIPVGAVIFNSTTFEIVATAHNQTVSHCNPLAHAEMSAIQAAAQKIGRYNLSGYSLFSTLEPCVMCAGACSWAKLDAVYFGASDPKSGGIDVGAQVFTHPQTHHKPLVYKGYYESDCGALMTRFFQNKRKNK